MSAEFQVTGKNSDALFSLKLHRGEGMTLIAMNWKTGEPPRDFVGFAIEYKEPDGDRFFALKNRIAFADALGNFNSKTLSTRLSPIQKFRWVHFPRNAEIFGKFVYRVSPVFMNAADELSYGEPQEAAIELRRETYPGQLNVTFTRGFISSQSFVERYETHGAISTLLPANSDDGLIFVPTHSKAKEALTWMGFEARNAILEVLDEAIKDEDAQVRVVAYDLSEADVVTRLEQLGNRLKIIIDDDGPHGEPHSGETQAEKRLAISAGVDNVKRQHMGKLQHNKTIVVDGPKVKAAVCGSTNFTWRGFFVQANNAVVVRGETAIKPFLAAFEDYWQNDSVAGFGLTASAKWISLGLDGINASVGFSPYSKQNSLLKKIADDIKTTKSSLFYSLAFLYQTKGVIRDALLEVTNHNDTFVYGISDKKIGGINLQKPDGNLAPVNPAALEKNIPEPFKSEPKGGGGNRLHHKFIVIDFNKPTARVYLGSYNFSKAADESNGENLLLIHDRRIATAYTIEALRLFAHYHFRVAQQEAKKVGTTLHLSKPPRSAGEEPWWVEHYTKAIKIRDREIFS